jgi:hypothetical protein
MFTNRLVNFKIAGNCVKPRNFAEENFKKNPNLTPTRQHNCRPKLNFHQKFCYLTYSAYSQ